MFTGMRMQFRGERKAGRRPRIGETLRLERPDLLAHARLGEMEALRGAAEVQLLGHRHERGELPQLHRAMIGAAFHRCEL